MVKFVENELLAIKEEVNDMWLLVRQQLENAFNALRNNDDDLANSVASREKRVNAFELKIDSDIEDFIALYNPVAVDLRFALAMLKINNNLERIGDYADSIARFVARNNLTEEDKQLFNVLELKEMYDKYYTCSLLRTKHLKIPMRLWQNRLSIKTTFWIHSIKKLLINWQSTLKQSVGHSILLRNSCHITQTGTYRRPYHQSSRRNRILHRRRSSETYSLYRTFYR